MISVLITRAMYLMGTYGFLQFLSCGGMQPNHRSESHAIWRRFI